MKYKITFQEAYASILYLNADFKYKGKKYKVCSTYYNGGRTGFVYGIDEIEVLNDDDSCIDNDALEDEILEVGKEIVENMDIEKYITT